MNDTINYYNTNAEAYFDSSVKADLSSLYDEFINYIPSGGSILDLGCGSGRDLKYYREHGYKAEGLDASNELCRLAEEYSGCAIYCDTIQDFNPTEKYDGIWACASLLHLTETELLSFFKRIDDFLKPDGIIFASMKSGITTGNDSRNRFFTNFSDELIDNILKDNPQLRLIKKWYSEDKMNRTDFKWLNYIFCNRNLFSVRGVKR